MDRFLSTPWRGGPTPSRESDAESLAEDVEDGDEGEDGALDVD